MIRLILARHGNTFGPGDTPVWVGANEDYPLVPRGLEQAAEVAGALERNNLKPDYIIAGPLLRTREGAQIIAARLGCTAPSIDERLTEIDYGSWGGKSDAEIEALHGAKVIEDWREKSIRPAGSDWSPDETTLRRHALDVLSEIRNRSEADATILLISSNGILRFYHAALYGGAADAPSGKVGTGHMCYAELSGSDIAQNLRWNVKPQNF